MTDDLSKWFVKDDDKKLCKTCKQLLPKSNFYKNTTTSDGKTNYCSDCLREKYRAKRLVKNKKKTLTDFESLY